MACKELSGEIVTWWNRNGNAIFLKYKEFRYNSVNFVIIHLHWTQNQFAIYPWIRYFSICSNRKINKKCVWNFIGDSKIFAISEILLYPFLLFVISDFYCICIPKQACVVLSKLNAVNFIKRTSVIVYVKENTN